MRFRILNKDALYDLREANKITQGIMLHPDDERPVYRQDTTEWWINQIMTGHSTLRGIRFRMIAEAPRSVVMQLIRATKEHPQPEVESSRPDWTGKERSSDPYEKKLFMQDHTVWSFIEMAKQRLCTRTETNTRKFMMDAVEELKKSDEPFFQALGYCCHPSCWWMNRCPEVRSCGQKPRIADEVIRMYRAANDTPLYSKEEEAEIAVDRR